MRKILVIAAREYVAAVRTKSFLISLLILPLMMGGSILVQLLLKDQVDTTEKRFAIVNRTPGQKLYGVLDAAGRERNEKTITDPKTGKQIKPVFAIEHVEPSPASAKDIEQQRFELSERVRRKEIFGFLEIGPNVLEYAETLANSKTPNAQDMLELPPLPPSEKVIRYQSESPTFDAFNHWADGVLNAAVAESRATNAGLSPGKLKQIREPVALVTKGLSKRNPQTGEIEDAPNQNEIASIAVPGGLMMLMFMLILVGSTPLMQGVVEEKMQRIAEVLLGSVRPFQMMMGKLIGMVAVSFTLSAVYLGAVFWSAHRYGFAQYIPADVLLWFLLYQMLAVLMFGSLFIAIGAACTDMRETQSMLWPVMLLIALPMFVWLNVIREPTSTFATCLSLFPFATPTLMLARQAVPPGIPWWQPVVGVVGVLLTTFLCVYAAGRIFRVGILMQGKGAQVGELIRWVFRG